jgi:adenylate kinase
MRTSPNIIITGTPGVGKTVHCEQLAQELGLKHLSINQVAKDRGCFDEYDEELKTWVVDEDKVGFSPISPHIKIKSAAILAAKF